MDTKGANYDTVLSIWTTEDTCATFDELECNDDDGIAATSFLAFNADAGQEYLIRVGSRNSEDGGSLVFSIPEPSWTLLAANAIVVLAQLERRRGARFL